MINAARGFIVIALIWYYVCVLAIIQGERGRTGDEREEMSSEEAAPARIVAEFYDLAERTYPEAFERHFGLPDAESYGEALELGRGLYVSEGCFHCHTQYVRAGTPDVERWGAPTDLRNSDRIGDGPSIGPPLIGARRIGPDLGREANRRSNDWHGAHLYMPGAVVPGSIMPPFPWFFEAPEGSDVAVPNKDGLAMIVYLQSLGADVDEDHR